MAKKDILILGAGVSGLSTGTLLLEQGYKVHIWAKDLPPNTTSNIAAAVWYPYLCNPRDKAIKWSGFTLKYLQNNALDYPESGCITRTITEIFDKKVDEPWWRDAVNTYRRPGQNELPKGYIDGYQTEAILMDVTIYMDWLLNKYKKAGGTLEQKEIKNIKEALEQYDTIVNCTGLGSRELFNDQGVFPVRGQVVSVKSNGFEEVIADDDGPNNLAVIIPRINDIILGGTAQINDWGLEINPKDTEDILRKAKLLSSAFNNVKVLGVKVGLRPARNEIRLEVEPYGSKNVIHNYGHGGAGFTLSWGCANDVVELIETLES
jgi:D-amino-acid oxidase